MVERPKRKKKPNAKYDRDEYVVGEEVDPNDEDQGEQSRSSPSVSKKQKINPDPDGPNEVFSAVKNRLKNIVKEEEDLRIIDEAVQRAHYIAIHLYHFLKLYLLWSFAQPPPFPEVNHNLLRNMVSVLCEKFGNVGRGGGPRKPNHILQ